MESIISLPYAEYIVANKLIQLFKKKDGYAVFVPVSRQQQGVDLPLANLHNGKSVKLQIKSSRTYENLNDPRKRQYSTWLNNFAANCAKDNADNYIIYCRYPEYNQKMNAAKNIWKDIFLCYPQKEMRAFLKEAKTKTGKPETFFGYRFDNSKKIYTGRGFTEEKDVSKYLLDTQIPKIAQSLK
jgi:hypothetical protein